MEGDPYCTHCGAHLKWDEDTTPPQRDGDELDDMLNSLFIDHENIQISYKVIKCAQQAII